MIIGIDANEANVKNRVGSNEYAYQVLMHLYKNQSAGRRIKFKIFLKEKPLKDLPKEASWWQYRVLKPKFLWTQWRLPLALILNRGEVDVFFSPGHYAPRFCPNPLVISIMDLAFLRFPKQFKKDDLYQLKNWTERSVKQADHILTISEFTKKEIIHFYNYPADKITVTYPGTRKLKVKSENSKVKIQKAKILEQYKIEKNKYFLYIGTLQPRKNLIRLIEAFARAINNETMKQFNNLVIVGKKGWLYQEIFEKVESLGLEKNVIFTGYVEEKEKNAFLENAFALILPSLYEGFGIPVLEAMQLGCPVIVSQNSSLPELVGKGGLYIDNPLSVDSIYKALLKMVKLDNKTRKELINRALKQAKKFSWPKVAKEILEVLCFTLKLNQARS